MVTLEIEGEHRTYVEFGKAQGEPVAEVVSKFGDPEVFGERELIAIKDIQKLPYGTKLYAEQPAPVAAAPINYGALGSGGAAGCVSG